MNLQSDAMTSGKCRSRMARKVFIRALVAYGALVSALAAHAATAGSTPAGAASSAQASGVSEGTAFPTRRRAFLAQRCAIRRPDTAHGGIPILRRPQTK